MKYVDRKPGSYIAAAARNDDWYLEKLARQRTRRRLKKNEDPDGEVKEVFSSKTPPAEKSIEEMVDELWEELYK